VVRFQGQPDLEDLEEQAKLARKWMRRYEMLDNRFSLQEPAIALHRVLLGMCGSNLALEQTCKAAKLATKEGNISYARCAMQRVSASLGEQAWSEPQEWWLRDAKVMWHERRDKVTFIYLSVCMHAHVYMQNLQKYTSISKQCRTCCECIS
jgi:hypothetical protein